MKENKTRFRYEAMQVMGGKIAILVMSMVSSIYFSRMLQAEGKGELSVVTAVAGILAQFGNLGLHSAHTYYVSKDRGLQALSEGNILILFFLSVMVSVVLFPILIINNEIVKISPYLIAIALINYIISLILMMQENLFLAIGDIREYNILQILPIAMNVVLVVIASVWFTVDVCLVSTFSVVSSVLTMAFSLKNRNMVKPKPSFSFFLKVMPYGIGSYVACLTSYLLLRTDILMMNYFLPKSDVGIYSQAVSLNDMLYMFSSSVSAVLFPRLSSFESVEQKANMVGKVMKVMTPVIFVSALVLGILARIVVLIMYGDGYLGSVPIVRVLLISSVAWGMSGFTFNFFASESRFAETIIVPLIGCILNIGMNYYLIPRMNGIGAAIASDVSYTFVVLAMFYCMYRYIKKQSNRQE